MYCGVNLVEFMAYETWFTPRILLSLIDRFPEGNEYAAELMGHRDFRDWSLDRYLLAGVINAVNTNSAVTGNWKNKPPDFPSITGPLDENGKPRRMAGQKDEKSFPAPHPPEAPGPSPRLLKLMGHFG